MTLESIAPVGSYTLTATAYAQPGGTGAALGSLSVEFTVAPTVLTGFVLVDATAHADLGALADGARLTELDAAKDYGFRVEAGANGGVESVTLALTGPGPDDEVSRIENHAPWSLYGDSDGNRACDVDGAICTAGGKMLSSSLSATVAGPPALRVADATVKEGPNATLDFVVTLDRAASGPVTVEYATVDYGATAGEDYEAASGTLTFAAGETAKTVEVRVLDDAVDDGGEQVKFVLFNPVHTTWCTALRKASLSAAVASSRSQMSRGSNSPRSGVAP